jgi:hypothetical protein
MPRALVAVLGLLLLSSCFGTVGVVGDVYDEGYPPAGYIATATPVYYQGYATYWYGGRWYWRDGGAWRAYRSEPGYLREHRASGLPPRQSYGRGHVVVGRHR